MYYTVNRITLDAHDVSPQVSITARQGDTTKEIRINISERGKPYKISEGCTAVLIRKNESNSQLGIDECTIDLDTGTIIYHFNAATALNAGILNCQVKLMDRAGELLTSPNFVIVVRANVVTSSDLGSVDNFTVLKEMIDEVGDMTENFETLSEELEEKIEQEVSAAKDDISAAVVKYVFVNTSDSFVTESVVTDGHLTKIVINNQRAVPDPMDLIVSHTGTLTVAIDGNYESYTNSQGSYVTIPAGKIATITGTINSVRRKVIIYSADLENSLEDKVDKEEGKGLSTNDYTDEEKQKVANALTQHQDISGKVDKVQGKGLSTNDYTNQDKDDLSQLKADLVSIINGAENLIDYDEITRGKYLGNPGILDGGQQYWITDFIPVEVGKTYTLNFVPSSFYTYGLYKADKSTHAGANRNYQLTESSSPYSIEITEAECAYIRISGTNYSQIVSGDNHLLTLKDASASASLADKIGWARVSGSVLYLYADQAMTSLITSVNLPSGGGGGGGTDTNTTYTFSISGNVITITDSDGCSQTVTVPTVSDDHINGLIKDIGDGWTDAEKETARERLGVSSGGSVAKHYDLVSTTTYEWTQEDAMHNVYARNLADYDDYIVEFVCINTTTSAGYVYFDDVPVVNLTGTNAMPTSSNTKAVIHVKNNNGMPYINHKNVSYSNQWSHYCTGVLNSSIWGYDRGMPSKVGLVYRSGYLTSATVKLYVAKEDDE